jgi:hypothetical protein
VHVRSKTCTTFVTGIRIVHNTPICEAYFGPQNLLIVFSESAFEDFFFVPICVLEGYGICYWILTDFWHSSCFDSSFILFKK